MTMRVLGISNNDLSGACLIKNNRLIAAISEERLTRIKNDKAWPEQSIAWVLQAGDIELDQIDFIAYGWHAGFNAHKHLLPYFDRIVDEARSFPNGLSHCRQRIADELNNDHDKRKEFDDFLRAHRLAPRAFYIDHHECHAAGAFACSPFDEAMTITCDGRGDFQSLTVSRYGPASCEVLQRETSIDSLGYFYGRITRLLGFTPNHHEGKVTGLAAYGDPLRLLPLMQQMIAFDNGRLRARCGEYFQPSYHGFSPVLVDRILAEKPEDVAAAAQFHVENLLEAVVRHHLRPGGEHLCLAGGVFANVRLNQRLREIPGVQNVYVLPCMGDGGLALAAAVGTCHIKSGARFRAQSMLIGPQPDDTQTSIALLATRYPELQWHRPETMIDTLVSALKNNQVLGMCKGRMEFGPRALCNRSILYHAADRTANHWLNARMHRTEFMPFAPVSALERAAECYEGWQDDHIAADFMTMTYTCHPLLRERCPAVVHVDGTARPQIIRSETDPFMHALLTAWHSETGQPALINTSFNQHEEPIVCGAADAFDALSRGMVDLVVLNEDLLVWKKDANAFARTHLGRDTHD
jgi:carbamoyltransferase